MNEEAGLGLAEPLHAGRRKMAEVNGEAIYGAGPTPFGQELGAFDNSRTDKKGGPLFVATADWRCTTRPGKLYIHLFK